MRLLRALASKARCPERIRAIGERERPSVVVAAPPDISGARQVRYRASCCVDQGYEQVSRRSTGRCVLPPSDAESGRTFSGFRVEVGFRPADDPA